MDEMPEHANDHPFIIACGASHMEISHYFVEIERHLIRVCGIYMLHALNINRFSILLEISNA